MSQRAESAGSSSGKTSGKAPPSPEETWRASFDAFERAIGRPLEKFVESEEFADAVARFLKDNAHLQAGFEQNAQAWTKLWNVPTGQNLEAVRSELTGIQAQLAEFGARLTALESERRARIVTTDEQAR